MTRARRYQVLVPAVVALLLLAMFAAGDAGYWRRYFAARFANDPSIPQQFYQPRAAVSGGDGGAMPRAPAEEQGLEPAALAIADRAAERQGASALLVSRNGHLIHEHYWQGASAGTPTDGGEWAQAVLALVTGAVVADARLDAGNALTALRAQLDGTRLPGDWRNPWSAGAQRYFGRDVERVFLEALTGSDYAGLLSSLLWKPVNAGDAWVWRGTAARSTCCLVARLADWLRVAELLLNDGVFEEERVVPAGWVAQILPLWQRAGPEPGPEPFVARGMFVLRGVQGSRLWLLPSQRLAILQVSARPQSGSADETTLPNSIVRGIVNRTAVSGAATDLHDLVPAH
ncbi:MAG TPA: hypothetical protein VGO41_07130 [Steroidobacteraceae bacterium]|jgi:hypothetical protein|nr:hypothetical protein [Steroidobacteraceae bacterium]